MALPPLLLASDSQDEKDQVDYGRIRALADRFKNARCPPTIISANLKGPFQVSPFATQKSLSPVIVADQKYSFTYEIPCEIPKLLNVTNVGIAKKDEQEGVAEIITGELKDLQYLLAKGCSDIQRSVSKSSPSRPSESTETIEDISASSSLSDERELSPSAEGSLFASLSPALAVTESRTKDIYDLGQLSDEDLYVSQWRKRKAAASSTSAVLPRPKTIKKQKPDIPNNSQSTEASCISSATTKNIQDPVLTPETLPQAAWSSGCVGAVTTSPQKTLLQIAVSPNSSPQHGRGLTTKSLACVSRCPRANDATDRILPTKSSTLAQNPSEISHVGSFDIDKSLADIESFLEKDINYQTSAVSVNETDNVKY